MQWASAAGSFVLPETSLVKLSQWGGKDPWGALGLDAVENRKKHLVWNGQFSKGHKKFPMCVISVWAELRLCWMILTYTDYQHLSLPALYEKPNIVMLFLFFHLSTETQIYRLNRWEANDNMLSSNKGSRSSCKKTHWKLLFEPWLKNISEPCGLIIYLTPAVPAPLKNKAHILSLLPLIIYGPIFLHVHSSK